MTLTLVLILLVVTAAARGSARLSQPPAPIAKSIRVASVVYGVPYWEAVSVARCETGGDFNPYSYNRSSGASGLFQFLRGTWARTPFARFSPFDHLANSLAAGWLWRSDGGSWSEWSCRP